jgi:hypothetical protein
MKRLLSAAVLALVLAAPFTSASAQTVTDDGVLTYSGAQTVRSAPFTLDPGSYSFGWTVDGSNGFNNRTACGIWLRATAGTTPPYGQSLLVNQVVQGQQSGQSYIYDLTGGTYYYDAQTCGDFTLTLQPM